MKKTVSLLLLYLGVWSLSSSQTIVSTTPQNKKAILEEFGGIYCVYCPEGNQFAESIVAANPDNVSRINIHQGLYANPEPGDPDFRSDFGTLYANQTGLNGYPAGTINRRVFTGWEQGNSGTTALGRGYWDAAVQQVLDQPSIVNIAAEATVDYQTNQLEIFVEIYYTGSSAVGTNYLNIALLQNKVYGPQLGGNEGTNYEHNHVLRDMITGQWGDPVYNTSQGHLESRSYEYQLPPDFRGVPFDSPNMELVIFVAESHQNILNGISVVPEFIVQHSHDANALLLPSPEIVCGNEITPVFTLRNDGNQPLTSLDIDYWINEESVHPFEWNGYLNTFGTEEIYLPGITFNGYPGEENYIHVAVHAPNDFPDENYDNNAVSTAFKLAPPSATSLVTLELKTDGFGFDIYWEITDQNNVVIAYGGNENVGENGGGTQTGLPSDPGAYGDNQTFSQQIELPGAGCYNFRILDDYGDGLCCQYGYGFYYLQDAEGNIIFTGGEFGAEKNEPFSFGTATTPVEDQIYFENLVVFPNPVTGNRLDFEMLMVDPGMLKVELFSADQRIRYYTFEETGVSGFFNGHIDTGTLPAGIYFLKLSSQKGSVSRKVVLLR